MWVGGGEFKSLGGEGGRRVRARESEVSVHGPECVCVCVDGRLSWPSFVLSFLLSLVVCQCQAFMPSRQPLLNQTASCELFSLKPHTDSKPMSTIITLYTNSRANPEAHTHSRLATKTQAKQKSKSCQKSQFVERY